MFLMVDTETSDLIKRHVALDDPSQPWVVTLSAELLNVDGESIDFFSTHIRADGRKVRDNAAAIHGVSSSQAGRSGVPEVAALAMLCHFAAQARYCVGYGIDFDRQVIEGVLLRRGKDPHLWTRPGLEFVDCMKAATPICKIIPDPPRDDGSYRWPTLDAACAHLLGETPRAGKHRSWDDCQRVRRLFFALRERGVLEIAA